MSNDDDNPATEVITQPSGWRLPVFLAVILLLLLGVGVWRQPAERADTPSARDDSASSGLAASLKIDAGQWQSDEEFFPWRAGMTVLDQLLLSSYRVEMFGAGKGAFVTSINGVANGGANGAGWQYWVNDQLGETSAAVHPLQPGDRVLWKHAPYE